VITVGLSHLTRNERIFTSSDIAVGIDILREAYNDETSFESEAGGHVLTSELDFVSSISSNSCAFRFRGAAAVLHISTIIEKSRAALEASMGATVFFITGCLSFSLFVLFSACTPSTTIPYVPTLGSMLYLLFFLPFLAASIAMGDGNEDLMEQVPPKNDETFIFGRREGSMFYTMVVCKAIFPALFSQLFHLIAFGELLIAFEPDLVAAACPGATDWVGVVRCKGISDYSGRAQTSSGNIAFLQFVLCIIVSSGGFVCRLYSLVEKNPRRYNHAWFFSIWIVIGLGVLYAAITISDGAASALPWYYYVLAATTPFICLISVELCKHPEIKLMRRAEKLRRLQFETRLGAWSPR
jgi:magnesium-transporting ATPase (P-type)